MLPDSNVFTTTSTGARTYHKTFVNGSSSESVDISAVSRTMLVSHNTSKQGVKRSVIKFGNTVNVSSIASNGTTIVKPLNFSAALTLVVPTGVESADVTKEIETLLAAAGTEDFLAAFRRGEA